MELSKRDLQRATQAGVITSEQAESLWKFLDQQSEVHAKFDLAHVAYYLGALIVIGGMGWFMNEAWERFGGLGLFLIASLYAICFVFAGRTLWYKERLKIPGGLLFTMAVCMTPLAVYGLERLTGIWPQGDPGIYRDFHFWIKGSWLIMEIATILAALIAIRFIRFPFLVAPIAFALWYMSMDLTPLLFGKMEFIYEEELLVSLIFGLAMLIFSFIIDRRTKEDYAFWLYFFGMLSFWGGLSLIDSKSEISKFGYCLINLFLMFLSIFLQRRVFIVFGSLGVTGYLGYLSYRVFKDSLMFPFVLTLLGISIIYLGVKYQRSSDRIEKFFLARIPSDLRWLLPAARLR